MEKQQAEVEEGEAAEVEQAVSVDIEADATLGYASIQNSVPVVRSIRVTNRTSEVLENIQLLVTCGPQFARGVKLRFDKLAPSESRRIAGIRQAFGDLQNSFSNKLRREKL